MEDTTVKFAFSSLNPWRRREVSGGAAEQFAEKYDSHIYAMFVAFGVPLLALLVHDFWTKVAIVAVWFAVAPISYFWLEGMEIVHQILKFGMLNQEQSDRQRRTMYDVYYGVAMACVIWFIAYAFYVGSHSAEYSGFWGLIVFTFISVGNAPLHYGVIEWGTLIETTIVARVTVHVFFAIITAFLHATGGQQRYETETRAPPPART